MKVNFFMNRNNIFSSEIKARSYSVCLKLFMLERCLLQMQLLDPGQPKA